MSIETILIVLFLATAVFIFAETYFKDNNKADTKERQYDQSPENYKRF